MNSRLIASLVFALFESPPFALDESSLTECACLLSIAALKQAASRFAIEGAKDAVLAAVESMQTTQSLAKIQSCTKGVHKLLKVALDSYHKLENEQIHALFGAAQQFFKIANQCVSRIKQAQV
jgi:hypothetical protein